MATTKNATRKKAPSSGSDLKSKRIVAEKMEATMGEFKRHKLKSSSGQKVTNPKQALAIALSEARQEGAKIPTSPVAGKNVSAKKRSDS